MAYIPNWNKEIKQLICKLEVENHYPDDNLIICYKDFLRIRDYLHCYQFNPTVFKSLVELTINLWETKEKINRLSLLTAIKRYHYNNSKRLLELDIQTKKHIFVLFKNTFEKAQFLTEKQVVAAQSLFNPLLISLSLTSEEEKWFCDNEGKTPFILNRILRYPVRSKIISQWVTEHFHSDKLRTRRAEAVGWILDENPDFIIDEQTLIDDFEHANLLDIEKIKSDSFHYGYRGGTVIKRFYTKLEIPADSNSLPDFECVRKYFYDNFDTIKRQTMLWAAAYSRLDIQQKIDLLKKYYSDELFVSLFNIGKKYKLIEILKWLQPKAKNHKDVSQKKISEEKFEDRELGEMPF